MLTILWALVILEAAALATVVVICRKELPAHFKSARGGYAIDEGALEGTLSDEVRDINFGGEAMTALLTVSGSDDYVQRLVRVLDEVGPHGIPATKLMPRVGVLPDVQ